MGGCIVIASTAVAIAEAVEKHIREVYPQAVIKQALNEVDLNRLLEGTGRGHIFLEANFCQVATVYLMTQKLSDNTKLRFVIFSFDILSPQDMGRFYNLGAIFLEEFTESYGQEFDRQCLLADEDPFTGAMAAGGVTTVTLGSADIRDLTWKDFRDAVYRVPAEERKDCAWFLHETVLNHIANIEDADGRPIWRRPAEAMPGKLSTGTGRG